MTRAVGYVRVSTGKQDVSLEAQEAKLRTMGLLKGWDVEIVIDRDEFSGDMNRAGLQRVLEMVQKREIGAVMITKLDRLTRSTADCIKLMELFRKKKVSLVSVAESLDTETSVGRFFITIIASIAQLERETIGERTRTAMQHMKRMGMPVGTAAYGWTRPKQSNRALPMSQKLPLIENPEEQAVLQEAIRSRQAGMTLREIADRLNGLQFRTRRGTAWRFQYVRKILADATHPGPIAP